MIKIAHRGNINGPSHKENQTGYLMDAVNAGYDVEFDLWKIKDLLWLGHNGPEYLIKESFLLDIGHAAWIHCKNLEALHFLNKTFPQLNYFWHQEDDYTLTSQGFIWAYPGKETTDRTVLVDLDGTSGNINVYAICGDNVGEL
jgi:hypothetical protein